MTGDPNDHIPPDAEIIVWNLDLRVLGQAVRVLQSFPVIPTTLPGAAPAGAPADDFRRAGDDLSQYQLQAVMRNNFV